jgi:DNA-binding MarR family transcriptional regulator
MTRPLGTHAVDHEIARDGRILRVSAEVDNSADAPSRPSTVDFGPAAGLAGFMLRLVQVQVYEAFFRDFQGREITPGQIGILIAIGCNPGVGQGVLAEALRIKRSNMAKVMRVLERDGMIERRVPARDQRAVELRLTRKGRALVERMLPEIEVSDRAAIPMLSERERATLLKLLARIAGYIAGYNGPGGS